MAVIVISPYFIAQEGLNYLYSYLAISNIVYSIYNYGNNGKLSFYYRSLGNKKKFIRMYSFARCMACLACVFAASELFDISAVILAFSILPLSVNFIEYLSECANEKDLEFYSKSKVVLFSIGFVVKCLIISRQEIILLLAVMNVEWVLLFLIVRKKLIIIPQSGFELSGRVWMKDSLHIYLSYFLQIFTTRFLYLNNLGEGKESFYILLRIVEAFSFIPNSYAARFFSSYHNSEKKELLLKGYLCASKNISLKTSFFSGSCIVVYFLLMSYDLDIRVLFVLICSFFLFKRISLSRYIIISNLIYTSILSYLIPALLVLPLSFYIKDAYALYGIYLILIYLTLPLIFFRKFENYIFYSYAYKN